MCGISGYITLEGGAVPQIAEAMANRLFHRGPDKGGVWADREAALSFRRLSILDLSEAGNQPMISHCGRYVLVFNGEVYNYEALRKELNAEWRGRSDSEVVLAALIQWGVPGAARRFNGMFAAALWDRQAKELFLLRDRFGKKPLYYGWFGKNFVFGSELKALAAHPAFTAEIDRDALTHYFRYAAIPTPRSIYRGIFKLPPGCYVRVQLNPQKTSLPAWYWSAKELVGLPSLKMSFDEATQALDECLREAIKLRMVADVPLGAFLSGGIDSSLVVALMAAQSPRPVRTFTIGFSDSRYDESKAASEIAKILGTDHTELILSPEDARAEIPRLPYFYDEPFADQSQIPTMMVSGLARHHVTVALSGDGGDEFFAGYNRHFWVGRLWNSMGKIPYPLRQQFSKVLGKIPPSLFKGIRSVSEPANKFGKFTRLLKARNAAEMYRSLVSQWQDPEELVLGSTEPNLFIDEPEALAIEKQMLFRDLVTYLPDDILTKVDRASMAYSLEVRCPFLDPNVASLAWQLPLDYKMREGKGKLILKNLLARYVPKENFERPKQGFAIPLDEWLRGPLRDWAESLLNESRLRREGYLDPEPIQKKWQAHLEKRENAQNALWAVLMFQAWLDRPPSSLKKVEIAPPPLRNLNVGSLEMTS